MAGRAALRLDGGWDRLGQREQGKKARHRRPPPLISRSPKRNASARERPA